MGLVIWMFTRLTAVVVIVVVGIACKLLASGKQNAPKEEAWQAPQGEPGPEAAVRGKNTLSALALVVGVIFVVLAGCIFATTTWRLMPREMKLLSVLVFAAGFFGVSLVAKKRLHIEKTATACYILGCIFLYLTWVTAGYFGFLGSVFLVGKSGWWCVLGMGSMAALTAMALGFHWFRTPVYRGIATVSALAAAAFFLLCFAGSIFERIFGQTEGGLPVIIFTFLAMAAVIGAGGWLFWKFGNWMAEAVFSLATMALVHYAVLFIGVEPTGQLLIMAAVTAACFGVCRLPFGKTGRRLGGTIGDCVWTVVLLGDVMVLALGCLFKQEDVLVQMEALGGMLLVGLVTGVWARRFAAVRAAAPIALWYTVVPAACILEQIFSGYDFLAWLSFLYACGFAVWDLKKRDVYGVALLIMGGVILPFLRLEDDASWRITWALLMGLCGCQFAWRGQYKKALAAAVILAMNALRAEALADTLILEGTCFVCCLLTHRNGSKRWAWIFGGLMAAAALYAMRDFWTEIAWWVYLLIAGIGLIVFAAVRERKD